MRVEELLSITLNMIVICGMIPFGMVLTQKERGKEKNRREYNKKVDRMMRSQAEFGDITLPEIELSGIDMLSENEGGENDEDSGGSEKESETEDGDRGVLWIENPLIEEGESETEKIIAYLAVPGR